MSKANEKRALRDRLTDEATTWLDDRACEYRYDYERVVDEMVDLLIAHRSAAERRALLSLARGADCEAQKWRVGTTGREALQVVAAWCRRRAKGVKSHSERLEALKEVTS